MPVYGCFSLLSSKKRHAGEVMGFAGRLSAAFDGRGTSYARKVLALVVERGVRHRIDVVIENPYVRPQPFIAEGLHRT